MQCEYKTIKLEMKQDAAGAVSFEGYAATFGNEDQVGDIIEQGAFSKSLQARKPKLLYQHNYECLIGVIPEIREDAKGLFMKAILADTEDGTDCGKLVKMGALDSMSIGYMVVDSEMKDNVRILKQLDLYEVSLVTFPANEQATITAVKKDLPKTVREFEKLLRDSGFPKEEAVRIASKGFKGEGEPPLESLISAPLTELVSNLKKTEAIWKF